MMGGFLPESSLAAKYYINPPNSFLIPPSFGTLGRIPSVPLGTPSMNPHGDFPILMRISLGIPPQEIPFIEPLVIAHGIPRRSTPKGL